MKNLFLTLFLIVGMINLNAATLNDGGVYQFEGVGSYAGKYCTVKAVGADDQLAFLPLPAKATDADIKKTQFKVTMVEKGVFTLESMSNPGYYVYPIRPAGKPWIVGMKKGLVKDDTDFLFKLNRAVTKNDAHISIVPIKNQAWVVGPFIGGIGMHMPGAFGYTEEGHWKGAFLPIDRNAPNTLVTTFTNGGVYQIEGVGSYTGRYCTVTGVEEDSQLGFLPLSNTATKAEVLKTKFKARINKDGHIAFESMSNPRYFIYPIRPAGKPWIVGVKKGPIADDTDFLFKAGPGITKSDTDVTIVPIKNQAWVMGPFTGGIGMHMPGVFGYTEEGHWKGAFRIYQSPMTAFKDKLPLATETKLIKGKKYYSESKKHYIVYQADGNLVVYNASDKFVWGSYQASGKMGKSAKFRRNGNLVVLDGADNLIWETGTKSHNASLDISDTGKLLIKSQGGKIIWESK